MRKPPSLYGSLCVVLLFALGCPAGKEEVVLTKPASPLEAGRGALSPDLIRLTHDRPVEGSERVVFLLGENHASIRSQVQVSALIGKLLEAHAIEAILVEGSNGSIDAKNFAADISGDASQGLGPYWRSQLEEGRISGVEYAALTQPETPVFGVEDMPAKLRHEIALEEKDPIPWPQGYGQRAAELLDQSVTALDGKVPRDRHAELRVTVANLRQALGRYNAARERSLKLFKNEQLVIILKQINSLRVRNAELEQKLHLAPVQDWQVEWTTLVKSHNAAVPVYEVDRKQLLDHEQLKQYGLNTDFDEYFLTLRRKVRILAEQLTREENEISALDEKLKNFEQSHKSDLTELKTGSKKLEEITEERERAGRRLGLSQENDQIEKAYLEFEDSFFISANLARELGASCGQQFPKLETFFSDEVNRLKTADLQSQSPEEHARDTAMVGNTMAFMEQNRIHAVAMIVGYAHLSGVSGELVNHKVSCVGGSVIGNDDDEAWQGRAWAKRKAGVQRVFSVPTSLKEGNLLLDYFWKQEQLAKVTYFKELTLPTRPDTEAGAAKIADLAKNRVVWLGKTPVDLSADVGEHIIDQGAVPGKPGEYYQVFDREIARQLVSKLSTRETAFVYYHRPAEKGPYEFAAPAGLLTFKEFASRPPATMSKTRAKRVVLFGAGDEVQEGSVTVSALWKKLRSGPESAGNDGSGEPPKGGRWTAGWYEDGEGKKRPGLFRTINPRRAQRNLLLLDRQKEAKHGEVTFIDEDDFTTLHQLKYTPRRGDHSKVVVLVARNVEEFRVEVHKAAQAGKLKNKQVALVTCGDAFALTQMLREMLLREGVLMVWVPDRQIEVATGQRLVQELKETLGALGPEGPHYALDDLVKMSFESWEKKTPGDPGLRDFDLSTFWVRLEQPAEDESKSLAMPRLEVVSNA